MQYNPHDLTDGQTFIRDSGVELLKIAAIFLIVISHTVQTLRVENLYISYSDYIINLSAATTNFQNFILTLLSYFGALGNSIFFICSAYFLLHSSKYNKRKCFFMLLEIWAVSVAILTFVLIEKHGNISLKLIIKSIFPTTFATNWYLTCYLLFYPLHPYLNILIQGMTQKELFRSSAALFVLYCCFNFIKDNLFFTSPIILWVTIYFVMAYLRLYMGDFMDSMRNNVIFIAVALIGYIGIAILANYLGLHIAYLNKKVLRWITNCNPFLIALSLGMFNLMRKLKFQNRTINYISSLSLLIYIIHENILFRTYYRPAMWEYIYKNFGYDNIISWVFVLALIVLLFGLSVSIIYDKTVRRFVRNVSDKTYFVAGKTYLKAEEVIIKLH